MAETTCEFPDESIDRNVGDKRYWKDGQEVCLKDPYHKKGKWRSANYSAAPPYEIWSHQIESISKDGDVLDRTVRWKNVGIPRVSPTMAESLGRQKGLPQDVINLIKKGGKRTSLSKRFCKCIKKVKRTVRVRPGLSPNKESAAIAICTKSMLYPRGRTIKRVRCIGRKHRLVTQKRRT
jgi:hypothetical protein